jgi:EmrB/QacA subfamily drug resistance transporter
MRRYIVFTVVGLALLLASISNSSASVAFPVIISDLNTTLVLAGWILTAYQLVQTIVMPLAGKLSDFFSRRTAFIVYASLFSLGSVLCALAPNVYLLIGARVIQAIGGGGFMPCAAGIVSDEFPEARQRYIGLFSSIFPIGAIIGPNIGGWMVEAFGWRSVFWFNVPLGVVVLVLSRMLLKAGKDSGSASGSGIDFTGAGLLFGSIFAFMFGLTQLGDVETGIPWLAVGLFFALGTGLMVVFIWWEHRVKEPIIDLELLKERPFLAANVYNLVYGICALGIFSLVPFYAVSIYGMSTLQSGVLLTPRSVAMMIASTLTSFYLMKWGYRRPILMGTIIVIVTLVLLALQPRGVDIGGLHLGGVLLLFFIVGIAGIGHGTCTPAANNACIELMPDKVATITGLRGMFRSLGGTLGVAIATVVIHAMGDVNRAFYVVMLAAAGLLLVSLPTIFMMPASPAVSLPPVPPAEPESR